MQKIATPQELQTGLLRILAYAQGAQRPERAKIASDLRELADRVAGNVTSAAKVPRNLEMLIRKVRNEGYEVKGHEVWVKFKTEADANKFEDRYNAKFDEDDEDDQDMMAYGGLNPKTGVYTITVPLD